MKKLFFDCGTRDATASFGLLVLRVVIPLMMLLGHGLPKIHAYPKNSGSFFVPDVPLLSHMSPQVSYIAVIGAEVGAAALLILGLATRPAAFVFAFTMVIAAFGAMQSAPWFISPQSPAAKEAALLYLVPAVTILLTGGGLYSLDALIDTDKKRRRR
ncbi:MAG: DoxX family protein [Luteolibacter sp.]